MFDLKMSSAYFSYIPFYTQSETNCIINSQAYKTHAYSTCSLYYLEANHYIVLTAI